MRKTIKRDLELYRKLLQGSTFRQLSAEYGLSLERIRQIQKEMAHLLENLDYWGTEAGAQDRRLLTTYLTLQRGNAAFWLERLDELEKLA